MVTTVQSGVERDVFIFGDKIPIGLNYCVRLRARAGLWRMNDIICYLPLTLAVYL